MSLQHLDLANKRAILIAFSATLALLSGASAALAATLNGDNSDNKLYGTSSSDTIKAYGGNDLIFGLGGSDSLYGGVDDDIIYGGTGNDNIYGWYGENRLFGQDGDDVIFATDDGSSGGCNYIRGGSGDDRVNVSRCSTIYGESGADTINANGEAVHKVYGGSGGDTITIDTDVPSQAYGGTGNDVLTNEFEGALFGESGDDILVADDWEGVMTEMTGGDGADQFRCGSGYETIHDYNPDEGDTLSGDCDVV
jgi:Ca2+-binding RTX toxin-like protein